MVRLADEARERLRNFGADFLSTRPAPPPPSPPPPTTRAARCPAPSAIVVPPEFCQPIEPPVMRVRRPVSQAYAATGNTRPSPPRTGIGIPSCDGSNYAFCGVRNRQAKPVPCRRLPESAAAPCRAIQNCHPQVIGLSCLSVYIYRPTLRLAAVFPPHPSRQTQPSLFFSQPRHSFYELGLRICTYTH